MEDAIKKNIKKIAKVKFKEEWYSMPHTCEPRQKQLEKFIEELDKKFDIKYKEDK